VASVDPTWLEELTGLLRIPSISADPAHADDVRRAGEWVVERIRASGGEAELVDWEGKWLAVGEIRASKDAGSVPTVLCYGHFDVQPPDPLDEWKADPFEPTIDGEWLVCRGVADDKGQLYMLLRAAAELAAAGELPVNVRFACDGEEEVGGHSIVDWIAADERGADAAIIFDSDMVARGRPAFSVATRGLNYFHVEVRTGERDLHSGVYGGAALNANHVLISILGGLLAKDGRVRDELRAGIVAPTEEELAGWRELPPGAGELATQGARPMDARAAEEFYARTFGETTVEVNGVEGGSPVLQKTVLPVFAQANVSLRLAPGQKPDGIAEAFERLVREAAPEGADVTVDRWSSSEPGLVPPDAPAIKLAQAAFEETVGTRPLLIRSGGSIPFVPALANRGIPAIVTGFALTESNIHSPNERLLLEYLPLGVETAKALFRRFAALPK
jgi:acetylornithine deacetylase/succinyl-diaminopimelate desuccinylase-like protein